MSVRELEKGVMNLTPGELSNFSQWFDHYRGGPAPPARGRPSNGLAGNQKKEILRRRDELLANPDLAEPVTDEMFERLKRKLAHARARKTPPS